MLDLLEGVLASLIFWWSGIALDALLAVLAFEHVIRLRWFVLFAGVTLVLAFVYSWLKQRRGPRGGNGEGSGGTSQRQSGSGVQIAGDVHGDVNVGHRLEAPPPQRMVFSGIHEKQIFHRIPVWVLGEATPPKPIYFVCQMSFKNEPGGGGAVAKALQAYITVQRKRMFYHEARGQWVTTNAPENAAFNTKDLRSTWDELAPNDDEIKLMVALKWPDEDDAYVWVGGGHEYKGWRHPSFRLEPGDYEVTIRLRGIEVDQAFVCKFTNPGKSGNPALSPPR